MTVLDIVQIGAPVLRQTAEKLSPEALASDEVQTFIDDLVETMRAANGAGLAANQVGRPVAICALEVGDNPRYPYKPKIPLTILVNPEIERLGEETFDNYEGCLSVPNLRGVVPRHARVRVRALTRDGEPFDEICEGFTAGTMQHEIDHLFGTLFVDRVQDPKTFATWDEFERHHKAGFMKTVEQVVAKYHRG